MDDDAGKVQALTTLSPIRPERLRDLRRRLAVVRYTPGLGRPLLDLGFIHYARWTIIDAFPSATGRGGRRALRSKYLLFQGMYDGEQDDYLDVFSEVIPSRIAAIWHACVGFEEHVELVPAARDRIIAPAAFRRFVRENALAVLGLYDAHRHSANAVRQAIRMRDRLDEAAALPPRDAADAAAAYGRIGSMALGPTPDRGDLLDRVREVYEPWRRAVRGQYGVNPLTVAIPLAPTESLTARVTADPDLGWLAGTETHYACICAIPRRTKDFGQRPADDLEGSYLLFTSDYFGDRYTYVEALRERLAQVGADLEDSIPGFPGVDSRARFHAWVDDHSVPTRYYVSGYPPRSVRDTERLLARREAVAAEYRKRAYPTADVITRAMERRS
jgi:hypothetical protein